MHSTEEKRLAEQSAPMRKTLFWTTQTPIALQLKPPPEPLPPPEAASAIPEPPVEQPESAPPASAAPATPDAPTAAPATLVETPPVAAKEVPGPATPIQSEPASAAQAPTTAGVPSGPPASSPISPVVSEPEAVVPPESSSIAEAPRSEPATAPQPPARPIPEPPVVPASPAAPVAAAPPPAPAPPLGQAPPPAAAAEVTPEPMPPAVAGKPATRVPQSVPQNPTPNANQGPKSILGLDTPPNPPAERITQAEQASELHPSGSPPMPFMEIAPARTRTGPVIVLLLLVVIGLAASAMYTRYEFRKLRDQFALANDSASAAAQESMMNDQRAWVGVTSAEPLPLGTYTGGFAVHVQNTGKSPALDVALSDHVELENLQELKGAQPGAQAPEAAAGLLMPGGTYSTTIGFKGSPETIAQVLSGQLRAVNYLTITYKDMFRRTHRTQACFYWYGTMKSVRPCDRFNNAE